MSFVSSIAALTAAALVSGGLLSPDFSPRTSGTMSSAPLMWETPVTFISPVYNTSLHMTPEIKAQVEAIQKTTAEKGPGPAAAQLEKSTEPVLILLRAGLKQRAGNLNGALADYEKILKSDNRTAPRAMALFGYKTVLRKKVADGEVSAYGPLIQCLKDEWRNQEALNIIPAALAEKKLPKDTRAFIQAQEPIMAMRMGYYDRAAELLGRPQDNSGLRWLAQTELRRGNFKRAADIRVGLAEKLPAGKQKSRDIDTAFSILAKAGLYDEAKALTRKFTRVSQTSDYQWLMGLGAALAGKRKEAREHFQIILNNAGNKANHPGANYLMGRMWELDGRNKEARQFFQKAASGPFGYYKILSQGRLEQTPGQSYLSRPLAGLLEAGPSGRDQHSLGFLMWITEKGMSADEMEAAAASLASGGKVFSSEGSKKAAENLNLAAAAALNERQWDGVSAVALKNDTLKLGLTAAAREVWPKLAASAAAQSGDYRTAVRSLSRIKGDGADTLKRWSHPLVYGREVLDARRRHGLSPSLLLALIRTESAFQADIMSASNARGLMQLLPATANRIAGILGEAEPGPLDLFDPALNIRYGSWYLKALIDGFGSEPLALAGYNGGPYNIKSFMRVKVGLPLDLFIETLPFDETVKYVKRITESRYIYETIYLGQSVRRDFTAPITPPAASLPDF
ncbi:hypothetical protein C4J81_02370 [Deltaproteobacteria bacterium Smac51]|nr:hypothetical protein C4J81_02370 [Deltaproteobacteria bacterium Smac51]